MSGIKKTTKGILDVCLPAGILPGIAIGLTIGIGAMQLRFGEELTNFDTARTYASNCSLTLKTFAENANLKLVLAKAE